MELIVINFFCSIVWVLLTWAIAMTIYYENEGCRAKI